jgi:hypothetical protein
MSCEPSKVQQRAAGMSQQPQLPAIFPISWKNNAGLKYFSNKTSYKEKIYKLIEMYINL